MSIRRTGIQKLKTGQYLMVENEPCLIKSSERSKSGKHGHAKIRIVCVGMFDNNKSCRSIRNSILYYQKKILLCIFITLKKEKLVSINEFLDLVKNEYKFEVKIHCADCGLDINYLPAMDIHHLFSDQKSYGFSNELKYKRIEEMIYLADTEKLEILCVNCHITRGATFFNEYKDNILKEEIDTVPYSCKKRLLGYITYANVIRDLFDGKFCYCGQIDIRKLPAISIHHLDPDLKQTEKLSNVLRNSRNIEEMKQLVINEKGIAICMNCHRFTYSSIFFKHKEEILGRFLKIF